MNRLYWVRHGETIVNLTKEFSCRFVDPPLTPKGVLQARQTVEALAGRGIAAVYCSPLRRASETAGIIAERLALPVTPLENFRETDVGDLERRRPDAEAWSLYMRVVDAWQRGDAAERFPGGEDYHELRARLLDGFRMLVHRHPGATLLVVGHGGSFSMVLPALCPEVDPGWLRAQAVENCSITELLLEEQDGRLHGRLVDWANYSHLHGDAAELVPGFPALDELEGR